MVIDTPGLQLAKAGELPTCPACRRLKLETTAKAKRPSARATSKHRLQFERRGH